MSIMRAQLARELQARGGISGLRHPAAYGGIMGEDGRRAYGWGSKLKKAFKKVTRPIKKIAKSPIGKAALLYGATAGLGNLAGGLGGAQKWGSFGWLNPSNVKTNLLGKAAQYITMPGSGRQFLMAPEKVGILSKLGLTKGAGSMMPTWLGATTAASALPFMMGGQEEEIDEVSMKISDKTGIDIESIREEVINAYKSGEDSVNALRVKYPFLADYDSVNIGDLATGGRVGYSTGKGVEREENSITSITEDPVAVPPPMFIDIEGQRAGPHWWFDRVQHLEFLGYSPEQASQIASDDDAYFEIVGGPKMAQGGRVPAQEGGIMDLGGMEKDYRNTGGFVEIGGEEKADDVPARLSRNEFVFTADAVRNAGGGDIDQGAAIMENVMRNLEEGGQISEDSQGMGGAQEMFDVSERLSEVV